MKPPFFFFFFSVRKALAGLSLGLAALLAAPAAQADAALYESFGGESPTSPPTRAPSRISPKPRSSVSGPS